MSHGGILVKEKAAGPLSRAPSQKTGRACALPPRKASSTGTGRDTGRNHHRGLDRDSWTARHPAKEFSLGQPPVFGRTSVGCLLASRV